MSHNDSQYSALATAEMTPIFRILPKVEFYRLFDIIRFLSSVLFHISTFTSLRLLVVARNPLQLSCPSSFEFSLCDARTTRYDKISTINLIKDLRTLAIMPHQNNNDSMHDTPLVVPSSPDFAPSSPDPLADIDVAPSQPTPLATSVHRPIQVSDFVPAQTIPRKRTTTSRAPTPEATRPPPALKHFEFTSQRLASMPKASTAAEAIDIARDMILQASRMATGTEQKQLLDLLEVFRDYTEKKRVNNHGLAVLSTQVNNLETVSRTLGSKVKLLQKPTPPQASTATVARQNTPSVPQPRSFAATAANATASGADWQMVGKKKTAEPAVKNKLSDRQLVLTRDSTDSFDSLQIRNEFNQAFMRKGVSAPVVASVTTSAKQNMVITTTPKFNAKYLLESKDVWGHITTYRSALLIESWHKVAIHNIPTSYSTNDSLATIVREIETFNKGLKVVGHPYWLTKPERRERQETGSICVAFATEREAQQAIRNRLYVLGISVRAEKLHSTAPTSQCTKCQRFGHTEARCTQQHYVCRICAGRHSTLTHKCNICNAKGRTCMHTMPVCANCEDPHTADSTVCDFYQARKNQRHHANNDHEYLNAHSDMEC